MDRRFLHPSAGGPSHQTGRAFTSAPVRPGDVTATDLYRVLASAERACCCPAPPVVMAVIPAATGRRDAVDLLLCGHHYRASRDALRAAGAAVHDSRAPLPGAAQCRPDAVAAN